MKLKNIYNAIVALALPLWGLGGLTSCADRWDDHYDRMGRNGTESLLQLVEERQELSDFVSLLRATHVYNNNHRTEVTYADLLASDQTLTVWAPVNGSFNVDSLRSLCGTEQGDSTVGRHFVMNHVAHHLYSMNAQTNEEVKMLNDKLLPLFPQSLYHATVRRGDYNLPATNGLLHVVEDDAQYTYNIYEALTSMAEFDHFGRFLSRFEKQELDENASIQAGIVDGKKVYSDSVMVKENALFRVLDKIMSEDSTFAMLVPDEATWKPVYEEAVRYFNYGAVERADSIGEYWANVALARDLIFNRNVQRSEQDSIFSTSYTPMEWPYHVFYEPFETGGLMDAANRKDSLLCSNGCIYRIKEWPFRAEDIYFHPIVTQGEREANVTGYKDCTLNVRSAIGDSISGNGYVDIVPRTSTSNWTATFEVRNTLSGTYDICAVILPKTVYLANSRDFKPNKFKATLNYVDEQGEKQSVSFNEERTNDPYRVDTVMIGRFTFPVCNYQQPDATVSVQLQCSITNRQTSYSREMFLDCIYLKPVSEDGEDGFSQQRMGRMRRMTNFLDNGLDGLDGLDRERKEGQK